MSQPPVVSTAPRDLDLDWFRGIGIILMFLVHVSIMIGMPTDSWAYHYHIDGIYSLYAWFFLASGMNAARAAQNDNRRPHGGRTMASYLLVNLALFVLGVIYSVNRRTFGQMELFCGIAACTAATYVLYRRRWPNWSLIVISLLLFGVVVKVNYLYWNFPHQEMFSPRLLPALRRVTHTLPIGPHGEALRFRAFGELAAGVINSFNLGERFLYVHFSLLPWVSWFILGGVMLRWARTKREWILWVLFAAMLAVSLLLPFYTNRMSLDFYLRAKMDFLLRSTSIGGMTLLIVRRFYKGVRPINKKIEFLGRESLLAFVLQWFFIDWCVPLRVIGQATGRQTWMIFPLVQLAAIVGTYLLTKLFAAWRDRTIANRNYLRNWLAVTLVFFLLSLAFYNRQPALSYLVSFPVIIGVAMAFPAIRLLIRKAVLPPKPATPPAATV